jgi:hypothetical protein
MRYAITALASTQHCTNLYFGVRNIGAYTFGNVRMVHPVEITLGAMLSVPDLPSPEVMCEAGVFGDDNELFPDALRFGYLLVYGGQAHFQRPRRLVAIRHDGQRIYQNH